MGGLVSNIFGNHDNGADFKAEAGTNLPQVGTAYDQTQAGINAQQQLMQALAAQNGIQNQSSVFNQLQNVANGTGPNPVQAQLAQQTGTNIANQAALMAGQRGAGANAGLLARQAAQQGGALQQQGAGQAATLQAQQQLGALGQLGGLANQQVAQQQGATQGFNQFAQGQQQNLLGALGAQNNANAQMSAANTAASANTFGAITNAIGGVAAAGAKAGAAGGGLVPNPKVAAVSPESRFPSKVLAPHIDHIAKIYHADKYAQGGKVPAMVSPGEVYLPPEKAKAVAKDGKNPIKTGEKIPGKPQVKGNSYANDTVPKKLETGGVVIPNSIMQSDDPVGNASAFVKKLMEKEGHGGKEHGDFKKALKLAITNRKAS